MLKIYLFIYFFFPPPFLDNFVVNIICCVRSNDTYALNDIINNCGLIFLFGYYLCSKNLLDL